MGMGAVSVLGGAFDRGDPRDRRCDRLVPPMIIKEGLLTIERFAIKIAEGRDANGVSRYSALTIVAYFDNII